MSRHVGSCAHTPGTWDYFWGQSDHGELTTATQPIARATFQSLSKYLAGTFYVPGQVLRHMLGKRRRGRFIPSSWS